MEAKITLSFMMLLTLIPISNLWSQDEQSEDSKNTIFVSAGFFADQVTHGQVSVALHKKLHAHSDNFWIDLKGCIGKFWDNRNSDYGGDFIQYFGGASVVFNYRILESSLGVMLPYYRSEGRAYWSGQGIIPRTEKGKKILPNVSLGLKYSTPKYSYGCGFGFPELIYVKSGYRF